ncbi:MAG: hypothetical protein QM831_04025 [Kofleriaceae bacterium]
MSRLLALASLVLCACGSTPAEIAGPAGKGSGSGSGDLTKSLPATLEATHPKIGDPRPLHVKVYADKGTRALPHWKEELTDQLDYAGQFLTPLLGIRMQVDSINDWDRTGSDPRAALKELAQVEPKPNDDTVWVIGYIAPADISSKAFMELGSTELLSRYVIVRSWAEKPEIEAMESVIAETKIGPQRNEAVAAQKRHKQTVILVNQLFKSLGAIDEADPSWIEHPLYSAKQNTLSIQNRDLIQIAVDARLGGGSNTQIAHDLLEAIEKANWGGWIPNDHDDTIKTLRNMLDAAKSGKTAADVPSAAYEAFDRVRELAKRGEYSRALAELDNLMGTYPGNATMQQEKCELLIEKPGAAVGKAPPPHDGVLQKQTRQACARVSELVPGDPAPHLAVGDALLKQPKPDYVAARAELEQAATKIVNLKQGQPEAWKRLVAIYMSIGALTWAEDAIAAGNVDDDPSKKEIAQKRARYGIPPKAKFVKPDGEAPLLAATIQAVQLIGAGKLPEGASALATADKKWPGAPGLSAMRCDLLFRQNNVDGARAACNRALSIDPDESWALYLGGVLALKDTSAAGTKSGIEKLKHAVAVDPDLGQAWRALGKAYDRAGDRAAHDELAKAYQAKFNQALP